MALNPRHVDIEDVLNRHDAGSGTAEAGAIVYLSGDKQVAKVAASGNKPYGMLGQAVKADPAGLPQNFQFPGQIGNSDARLGDPVLVYHSGQFETTHYVLPAGIAAGAPLYCGAAVVAEQSKLIASGTGAALGLDSLPKVVALAQSALSADEAADGKALLIELLV
jgi:hypothetical protein